MTDKEKKKTYEDLKKKWGGEKLKTWQQKVGELQKRKVGGASAASAGPSGEGKKGETPQENKPGDKFNCKNCNAVINQYPCGVCKFDPSAKGKGEPKDKKSGIAGTLLKVGGIFALIIAVVVGGIFGYKFFPESAKAEIGKYFKTLSCMFSGDYQQCMISEQTPEAEKVGGYQAVTIQFGSKYNDYIVPTVYANDISGYYLPITVSNPNPEENKELTVENFSIKSSFWSDDPGVPDNHHEGDVDMIGGSNLKIMCGFADTCNETNNVECQKLLPGIDKEIILRFEDGNGSANCPSASDFKIRISDSECKGMCNNGTIDQTCSENTTCANDLCESKCKAPEYKFLDFVNCTYDANQKKCVFERNKNNFSELCSEKFGESTTVKFLVNYSFFVVGNGEFGFVQTEKDLKVLPKPKITTSAGPLSLTVYFLPSYIINEKNTGREIRMFLNLKNDGGGDAVVNNINITQNIQDTAQVRFDQNNFNSCLNGEKIRVSSDESWGKSCNLGILSVSGQTGPFATIPITVSMKYSYEETISKSIPIKKVSFDPIKQSEFVGTPGYCPT
jgi:hypothetical protein